VCIAVGLKFKCNLTPNARVCFEVGALVATQAFGNPGTSYVPPCHFFCTGNMHLLHRM
jgi:hypothetical protein